jgi:excisionase family DNA binding protein
MPGIVLRLQPAESDRFAELRDQIDAIVRGPRPVYLLGQDGAPVELPASASEALKLVVDALARGQSVALESHEEELTSQEAADVLHVSRPHLIKLLDQAQIPFHRVGTHRRIRLEDVLAYRDRRRAERKAGLDELARLSEELPGGYR